MLASGEYATARDVFETLTQELPNDSSLFVGLGNSQIGLIDNDAALVAFNTALQINPNSKRAQDGLDQVINDK